MHEKNKAPPPRVAAMCPLDLSVPIGLSLAFLLTTIDIEAIVQQVLSHTSTIFSVISGKQL